MGMPVINPHQKVTAQGVPPISTSPAPDATISYSFNVPFASDLAGPNTEEILHATTDAVLRWTHPEDAPDDVPVHELPVHAQNLAVLQDMCKDITRQTAGAVEAHVITTVRQAQAVSTTPKVPRQVTTVCLSGVAEAVYKCRESILNDTPLSLVGAVVCCRLSAPSVIC